MFNQGTPHEVGSSGEGKIETFVPQIGKKSPVTERGLNQRMDFFPWALIAILHIAQGGSDSRTPKCRPECRDKGNFTTDQGCQVDTKLSE